MLQARTHQGEVQVIDLLHPSEETKHVIDIGAVVAVIGSLANFLPDVAALITIVWGCIRIYETHTVQRWLGKEKDDG